MIKKTVFALMLGIFCVASCSSPQTKNAGTTEEKADPSLKDKIIDYKEYYDDKSLKGEGKVLYKIMMNKPKRIKQQKWVYYVKGKPGIKMSEGEYTDDKQTGKWTFFFESGKVREEGTYTDGVTTGEWLVYYPTGELFTKATYKVFQEKDEVSGSMKSVGHPDGTKISYYKKGTSTPLKEEEYHNGKKNGRTQEYYETGKPKQFVMFKDDKKNGALNEWWESTNKQLKKTEGFFTDDKKTGSWKMYYNNGIVAMEGNFNADKPDGLWKFYSRETQLMKEGKYKMAKEDGLWTYYEYINNRKVMAMELAISGGMVASGGSRIYENGILIGEGDLNGIPKAIFQIYKNKQESETIESQNQPDDDPAQGLTSKWTGKWNHIKKNGLWREFYTGTKNKKSEANYMMDKKNGEYKEFYLNGKIKAEGKYLTDKKNDQWKFYNQDGSLDSALSGLYMMDKKR
jgi:uncharacterized protein